MQAHRFTGVWRKWQKQYDPEDPRSRTKFLAADVARIEAKLAERAVTAGTLADQQQARATNTTATLSPIGATCGSDEDLENAQHEIAQADEQGVPVTLSQRHINNRSVDFDRDSRHRANVFQCSALPVWVELIVCGSCR